jgi:UDP-glucose 4-epimerase
MAQQKKVLITGGAGYIGSVVTHELVQRGYGVIIVDRKPIAPIFRSCAEVHAVQADYADSVVVGALLRTYTIAAVIHLAAYIEVGESVHDPARYYDNNVKKILEFLELLRAARVQTIIAASSGAVYGNPHVLPMTEDHPCEPLSPYGRTKLILEWILRDYAAAYGITYGILRYSNVAGAMPELGLREAHEPETHLIPRLFSALHAQIPFVIRGTDYPTKDGTGVRDFIHVHDVARANSALVRYFEHADAKSVILNISSGRGTSVRDVINVIHEVTGEELIVDNAPRRAGDAAEIVLSSQAASALFNWKPIYSDIRSIIASTQG